ncbi:MAG TPA: succinate dehydrogenase assembly factor 2 [Candidatus Omnitrophota bacterium]|nr:succinate dehydrogenase assembly factor 2 [Candidatus Omnitrophota bacterium]
MFRAHHMGSNENDILFGGFAERYLASLAPEQVDRFEALIQETDTDLFNWVTGKEPVPAHLDHDVMAMMKKFVKTEAART